MIVELVILGGLFLIFIGMLMLIVINFLEAREEKKLSERLSKSFRNGDSFDDIRFKDYE